MLKFLLFFFIFFPYLNPVNTPWSLQPFALFFSIIYLFINKISKINIYVFIFLIIGIISIFISIISYGMFINSIRSVANYLSVPLIIWAVYVLNPTSQYAVKFINMAGYTYIFVGFIQYFVFTNFLTFLVPHQSDNVFLMASGRGVNSLAPEPSYFGFILLLFFFLSVLNKNKKLMYLSILSILFLSQSFSVIICLFISIVFLLLFKNMKFFFISIIIFIVSLFSLNFIFTILDLNSRSLFLLKKVFENGISDLFDGDASANGRLFHIVYPIEASFKNYFFPFAYNGLPNGDTRILSGFSGAVYELGFFSFPLILTFLILIFKGNFLKFNVKLSVGFGLICFILNANQFGMPIFCFVLGYILFLKYNYVKSSRTLL
jgi:hypothetical protein